jgi:hypothetical protein
MAGSIPFPSSRILIKWRQDPESRPSFTIFDALDGPLPFGNGYNFQPTASRGPDGKVWFATGSAIQMIDSDHTYKNELPPPVHVEQLIADNKPFRAAGFWLPPNPAAVNAWFHPVTAHHLFEVRPGEIGYITQRTNRIGNSFGRVVIDRFVA